MNLTLKTILSSQPNSFKYNRFYNIDNKYILGDRGMLIDRTGDLLWREPWQHSIFMKKIYIKSLNILVTDRHTMPGPCTMRLGICAIDMNNGKYLWHHWYDNSYEERMALRQDKDKRRNDIRLISFTAEVINGEYILTDGFKINLGTGEYTTLENDYYNKGISSTEEGITPMEIDQVTVDYRGTVKNFSENGECKIDEKKLDLYQKVIKEIEEQKLLNGKRIYSFIEFFSNSFLLIVEDRKLKKEEILLLTYKE